MIKLNRPNTTPEQEEEFLHLIQISLSLTPAEKTNIILAASKLSQEQFDGLIKIFKSEQEKFKELEEKHEEQITELRKNAARDWYEVQNKLGEPTEADTNDETTERIGLDPDPEDEIPFEGKEEEVDPDQ
jgi:hypothetical protein